MLKISIKTYQELTKEELYAILQLRSEVFVVEQDCVYQDIDYKDQKAFHLLGFKDLKLVAYARIFKPGDYFKEASIGRVLVKEEYRKHKYGHILMDEAIKMITNKLQLTIIKISAQKYLKKFYKTHGFVQVGDEYLEDGIPHIAMIKE